MHALEHIGFGDAEIVQHRPRGLDAGCSEILAEFMPLRDPRPFAWGRMPAGAKVQCQE